MTSPLSRASQGSARGRLLAPELRQSSAYGPFLSDSSSTGPDLRRIGRFLALDGGRSYVVKVPGVMASGLDDAQVAGVVNWVLATLARDTAPAGQPPREQMCHQPLGLVSERPRAGTMDTSHAANPRH